MTKSGKTSGGLPTLFGSFFNSFGNTKKKLEELAKEATVSARDA
jgi:hypothetical protein